MFPPTPLPLLVVDLIYIRNHKLIALLLVLLVLLRLLMLPLLMLHLALLLHILVLGISLYNETRLSMYQNPPQAMLLMVLVLMVSKPLLVLYLMGMDQGKQLALLDLAMLEGILVKVVVYKLVVKMLLRVLL